MPAIERTPLLGACHRLNCLNISQEHAPFSPGYTNNGIPRLDNAPINTEVRTDVASRCGGVEQLASFGITRETLSVLAMTGLVQGSAPTSESSGVHSRSLVPRRARLHQVRISAKALGEASTRAMTRSHHTQHSSTQCVLAVLERTPVLKTSSCPPVWPQVRIGALLGSDKQSLEPPSPVGLPLPNGADGVLSGSRPDQPYFPFMLSTTQSQHRAPSVRESIIRDQLKDYAMLAVAWQVCPSLVSLEI